MYNLENLIPSLKIKETYDVPLDERIAYLDYSGKKKNIVYLYPEKDYGTFRYRCYNTCQVLNKTDKFAASFFFQNEISSILEIIKNIDLIVFARVYWDYNLDVLIQKSIQGEIPLIYDVDDLVFDINETPILANNLTTPPEGLDYWFAYFARRYYAAKFCKSFISTNGFLDQKIKAVFPDKNTYILPNFLNDEQIEISNLLYDEKLKNEVPETFLIGYFSGTASHNQDFGMISDELARVLDTFDNVKLRIVGPLELTGRLKDLEHIGKVQRLPLMNYIELQLRIAECDLNLVPLVENEFTNCKSQLKYFESGVVGTPTIASPIYSYKNSILEGVTGFIAKSGKWGEKIKLVIKYKEHLKEVSQNARKDALENYYGDKIQMDLIKIVEEVLN